VKLLKNNIIALRQLKKSDRKLLALYANNKKIKENLRDVMPYPYTLEDADRFIEGVLNENPAHTFAIVRNKKFVGICGLNLKTDIYRKSCEVGYWVAEQYWGTGIASEALVLLTSYAFEKLDIIRVYSGVFEYNLASMRVLEKCGYIKEGVFKKALIKDGKYYDEVRFAAVR
jgi:RimJ/RimL family protein N-acetyltransferase